MRRHVTLRRRRSYARRQFSDRLFAFLRGNWRVLLAFVACCAVSVIPVSMFLSGYLLGLLHGAMTVAAVAAIGLLFLLYTGSSRELSGAYGEDNTRDVLRVAKRRRHVWGWVDNIEVQGGDVDHLVVTPAGILAIDSKWHGTDLTDTVLRTDIAAATRAARVGNLILRSVRIHDLQVQPLVVLWGRAKEDLDQQHRVIGGVAVVGGLELRDWLARHSSGTLTKQRAEEVLTELRNFKARVDPSRRLTIPDRHRAESRP
jgi:hypothetical protein